MTKAPGPRDSQQFTVYAIKYVPSMVVLCFVVVMLSILSGMIYPTFFKVISLALGQSWQSMFSYGITKLHWNENVIILMEFSSLAALEVVILTTSSAVSDENFVKMTTFSYQCIASSWFWIMFLYIWYHLSGWLTRFLQVFFPEFESQYRKSFLCGLLGISLT